MKKVAGIKSILTQPFGRPRLSLTVYFIAWKLILLLIALTSPGPGYDTSTALISELIDETKNSTSLFEAIAGKLSSKLVRWDAIYFTQIAQRGYVFEQEWAFGWGFTRLLGFVGRGITYAGLSDPNWAEAIAGIVTAHICHLLSVFMLYSLSKTAFQSSSDGKTNKKSFISACLHIVSPAGIFLSAPCAESPFAFLQFAGYYFYAISAEARLRGSTALGGMYLVVAGCLMGLATTFRSNGLFSGLIFTYDAVEDAVTFFRNDRSIESLQKLLVTILAGSFVASGIIVPQYLAYQEFCMDTPGAKSRAWCSKPVPSIYAWVQSHYWNVGFLRYWTVSNIPLFILALPMLILMTRSTIWAWTELSGPNGSSMHDKDTMRKVSENGNRGFGEDITHALVRRFSLPQAALAVTALAVYHVQIITRISSGYPVWYWWLATMMVENHEHDAIGKGSKIPIIATRWIVIYAMIQGGLFASFLPPA